MTILSLIKSIFFPFGSSTVSDDFIGAFSNSPENYGF